MYTKGSTTKPGNSKDKNVGSISKCSTSANVASSNVPSDAQEDANEESETVCHAVSAYFVLQKNLEEVGSDMSIFTVKSSDNKLTVQGLYGIGSQSSFLVDKYVTNLDHMVLKRNIKLAFKGINE